LLEFEFVRRTGWLCWGGGIGGRVTVREVNNRLEAQKETKGRQQKRVAVSRDIQEMNTLWLWKISDNEVQRQQ